MYENVHQQQLPGPLCIEYLFHSLFAASLHRKCPQVIHLILQRGQYISASLRRPPKKKTSLTTPYSQSQLSLRPRPSRTSLSGLSPEHHQHHSTSRRASTPLYESSLTQPDSVIAENGDHTINRWSLSRSREQLFASQGQLRSAESVGQGQLRSAESVGHCKSIKL